MLIRFSAPLWLWKGQAPASWHFITLPEAESAMIRMAVPKGGRNRGWGSVRVKVTIGQTSWNTSIFPDTKRNAYLLPVKAEVRKAENLGVDEIVDITISLDL